MNRVAQYFIPTSITWWVGVILTLSGLFRVWGIEIPYITPAVRPLVDVMFGSSDPGVLIMSGLGAIGLRRKLEDVI